MCQRDGHRVPEGCGYVLYRYVCVYIYMHVWVCIRGCGSLYLHIYIYVWMCKGVW